MSLLLALAAIACSRKPAAPPVDPIDAFPTRLGEETIAKVRALTESVEVVLFYPPNNPVLDELRLYFDDLARESGGRVTVRAVDQALDPALAQALAVRDNGTIAFIQGEMREKIRLDADPQRAAPHLCRLDDLVREHLMALGREPRPVYFLGEASGEGDPFRKLHVFKTEILEPQKLYAATLSISEGASVAVPDDAALVIITASRPLLPEELAALKAYFDRGGGLLVLLDPSADPPTELLAYLGVEVGTAPLANAAAHARVSGGLGDVVMIATNKYGIHPVVETLARNSAIANMLLPNTVLVREAAGSSGESSTLVRSMPETWPDSDRDFQPDEGEAKGVYDLAIAVARGDSRAIIIGSIGVFADTPITSLRANAVFGLDSVRWLDDTLASDGGAPSEAPKPCDEETKVFPSTPPRELPLYTASDTDLQTLNWTSDDRQVSVERRTDQHGVYLWIEAVETKKSGDKSEIERFMANALGWEMWRSFAPLVALRALDVGDTDLATLGLDDQSPKTMISVGHRAKPVLLRVGGETYGSKDRYVQVDSEVYLVDDGKLRPLQFAATRLVERALIPLEVADIEQIEVKRAGCAPVSYLQQNRSDQAAAFWTSGADKQPDLAGGIWLQKVFRLKLYDYVEESAIAGRLEPVVSYTATGGGGNWPVELYKTAAEPTRWYARSAFNRGIVEIGESLARSVVDDVGAVVCAPEK